MTFSFSEAGRYCPVRRRQSCLVWRSRADPGGGRDILPPGRGRAFRGISPGTECKAFGETDRAGLVLDLKALLHLLEFAEKPNVFDAGVQDTFWIPLERDTIMISCPEAISACLCLPGPNFWKEDAGDALARGEEKAAACACYMGYAVWKAGPVLLEKLADTGWTGCTGRLRCL